MNHIHDGCIIANINMRKSNDPSIIKGNSDIGDRIEIIASFIILFLGFLLSPLLQNLLRGMLIVSLGILHGANDIRILSQPTKKIFPAFFTIHKNEGNGIGGVRLPKRQRYL